MITPWLPRATTKRYRIILMLKYLLESDVDDYVKSKLIALGLKKRVDFNEKSSMSEYMKESLKGSAKTPNKSNFGQPDFTCEKYNVPVVIEDKLHNDKHIAVTKAGIKMDEKSIREYAVNGALHYARNMILSKKYNEVIAIGISGESSEEIKISIFYVFSATIPPKHMQNYRNLNFLQNFQSFKAFYNDATITDKERHEILIYTRNEILRQAKKLNILMNNCNIGVEQRVVYVSGMLLSMQDVIDKDGNVIDYGLTIDDLKGIETEQKRDSIQIISHIEEYIEQKNIDSVKKRIMIEQFKNSISLDPSRDKPVKCDKNVGSLLKDDSSITKQVFSFLYEYVYKAIDMTQGALDIMAEMYSTFLKYALSDGASLGKVLTPPYITNMMAKILDINKDSKVMDLATGSAAFLVASMDLMINDANKQYGKGTTFANQAIENIKKNQLLGIEVDAKMYTLAAANMLLRGDGSSNIIKADSFTTPEQLFRDFSANRLLLNPPFSYESFGLPFFEFGLDNMQVGGIGAVIIQDSAGSGKANSVTKRILNKHTMLASIKMPADLFIPNAIVQTSIYVFRAKRPHDFEHDIVKFIDFRTDGYKRTKRIIQEVDNPSDRYNDIYLIYKLGKNAVRNKSFHGDLWNLDRVYCEDTISENGDDWNFEKHIQHITIPTEEEFITALKKTESWNISQIIKGFDIDILSEIREPLGFKDIPAGEIFTIKSATPSYDKLDLEPVIDGQQSYDYITRTSENHGICDVTSFISDNGKQEAGTFSLGLMQMIFFLRKREWYAGQFVKVIACKYDVSYDAKVYLQTILNGLTSKLLSVLVRDVEKTFETTYLRLPIKPDDTIDYDWMQEYVVKGRSLIKSKLIECGLLE